MRITVRLTEQEYNYLNMLVEQGMYMSISDAIRDMIRQNMRGR